MQASPFLFSPQPTPRSVKLLIWITLLISLLSPIVTFITTHYFGMAGAQEWLALSYPGMRNGWLWEPVTYIFIHSMGEGISLSLLISLFFHMFLLWFSGSEIVSRFGIKVLLLLYLGGGIFSGLIALLALYLFGSPLPLFGSGPAVYALLFFWTMLYPDLKLFFLFIFQVKVKWLVALLLGIILLINLSSGEWISFLANLSGIFWGWLMGRFVGKLSNPYPFSIHRRSKKGERSNNDKIIDLFGSNRR